MKRPVTLSDILNGHAVLDIQCLDWIYLNGFVGARRPAGRWSGSCITWVPGDVGQGREWVPAGDEVTTPIADIAAVDAIDIRPPSASHPQRTADAQFLLPLLVAIPGTGPSYGAHMLADPFLDLADAAERREQTDQWLCTMAIDAGLLGMEELVARSRL